MCPLPILRTRKFLEKVIVGEIIEITSSDQMTRIDIPHFCQEAGHKLISQREKGTLLIFEIQKNTA